MYREIQHSKEFAEQKIEIKENSFYNLAQKALKILEKPTVNNEDFINKPQNKKIDVNKLSIKKLQNMKSSEEFPVPAISRPKPLKTAFRRTNIIGN